MLAIADVPGIPAATLREAVLSVLVALRAAHRAGARNGGGGSDHDGGGGSGAALRVARAGAAALEASAGALASALVARFAAEPPLPPPTDEVSRRQARGLAEGAAALGPAPEEGKEPAAGAAAKVGAAAEGAAAGAAAKAGVAGAAVAWQPSAEHVALAVVRSQALGGVLAPALAAVGDPGALFAALEGRLDAAERWAGGRRLGIRGEGLA